MNIKSLKITTLVAFLLIIFSASYLIQSFNYNYWYGYGPGAGFVPLWCSGIMLILSIICFIQSFKSEGMLVTDVFPKGIGRINIIATWLALIFFAVAAKKLGLLITGVIMSSILFGRSTKWYKAILYSIILTVCCFVLFKMILQVPVPINKLGF